MATVQGVIRDQPASGCGMWNCSGRSSGRSSFSNNSSTKIATTTTAAKHNRQKQQQRQQQQQQQLHSPRAVRLAVGEGEIGGDLPRHASIVTLRPDLPPVECLHLLGWGVGGQGA